MNELVIHMDTLPVFENKTLNTTTRKIAAIGAKIAKNLYSVAFLLNKVNEEKAYEQDGFKTCAEYATKTFGFKKSMAYTLIKIGAEYTGENQESNLPHEEGHDFTVTQIEKCLPLKDHNKVVELVQGEVITSDMSCKEIEKVVKGIMKPGADDTDCEVQEEPVTEETVRTVEDLTRELIQHCDSIVDLFKEAKESGMDKTVLTKAVITMCEMINTISA